MQVLTITLNAAVDTTYILGRFVTGKTHRVERVLATPGGKGNNVARVLAALGHTVWATGFIAGHAGQFIADGVRAAGVADAFLCVPGESRRCLTLIERETKTTSEFLEPGVTIAPPDAERFLAMLPALVKDARAVVVSGSLPNGLPPDFYAHLLTVLRTAGAPEMRVVLDTSGEALRDGLAGQPYLLKPNSDEMTALLGPMPDLASTVRAARARLLPLLAPDAAVLLSRGAAGAVLITARVALTAVPPAVTVVNTVGAGDAMLAGWLDAQAAKADPGRALAHAVATGTAATLCETAGEVDLTAIARIEAGVCVTPLDSESLAD